MCSACSARQVATASCGNKKRIYVIVKRIKNFDPVRVYVIYW